MSAHMRTAPFSVVMAQFYRLHTSIQKYLRHIEKKCVILYCVIGWWKQAKLLNIVTKSKNYPCPFSMQMYVTRTNEQSTYCFAYTFLLLKKWEFGFNTFLKFVPYLHNSHMVRANITQQTLACSKTRIFIHDSVTISSTSIRFNELNTVFL